MHEDLAADLRRRLERAHADHAGDEGGSPATYVPELAGVDRSLFGLAACGLRGEQSAAGDADHAFTLQSLSKPFVYAWALERFGEAAVHARVGVEPTGDAFDSIVRLDESSRRPHNPMVNAGAIAVTGLLLERGTTVAQVLAFLGACAGRAALEVDVPVWLSERSAAHTNRAIAHLLAHFGALCAPVDSTLDLYFRQCAALVTCRDLARMAATLARHGVSPVSGERVLSADAVRKGLAVMSTCGLYDATGRFVYDVGLPAKSGVSGGLLVVAPGRLGLAGFSPALDAEGTSVRARAALLGVAAGLDLHRFDPQENGPDPSAEADRARLLPALREAHAAAPDRGEGLLADYAPSLASAPRASLGIAVCTVAGREAEVGDTRAPFTLQAVANAFCYAHVHASIGEREIERRAGVEPSGNPFHAIPFHTRTGLPFNPLGNAGAIATASLAPGGDEAGRLRASLAFLSAAADRDLRVDAATLDAETAAGSRNRAIAALLRGRGVVEDEELALRLYLQHCCIGVDARTLARMAAMLAAGGLPPRTGGLPPRTGGSPPPTEGRRLLGRRTVRDTLSLMYTCGLHDGSGRFAFEVGIPAKSGISGAIAAVVPGRMGIAVWSPAVDRQGTSVRGFEALRALSRALDLSAFAAQPRSRNSI